MSRRTYIALVAALTLFAAVRVASTHRLFSETVDEPLHLAGGWEWLGGDYTIDISHPPFGRVLCALPLRFAALPDPPDLDEVEKGNYLLYYGDRYLKNLARARIGTLPFLVIAILAVAAQARRAFGPEIAVMAAAMFTSVPSLLAHAGLITTDMAVTAAIPLALLALDRFLESPRLGRAAVLGGAVAFGVLAKFSFFVYFPAAALVLLAVRRPLRVPPRAVAVLLAVAFFAVWAGYQFDLRTMGEVFPDAGFYFAEPWPEAWRPSMRWFADHVPVPAPALPVGLGILKLHDAQGHVAYLFGQTSTAGWWYYFPVVFFYKTPLPFLALSLAGIVLALRRRRGVEHALIPAAILLVAMMGSINIGIRHVLPVYGSLAIVAAYATRELWRMTEPAPYARLAFCGLLAWLFAGSAAAHPDYLAYFNEAAGERPARIAVDSNLDWGQDVLRLERAVRELKIARLYVLYSTNARLEHHAIPSAGPPQQPVSGWIAAGETPLAFNADQYRWLTRYEPVRRIGKSIRLYYLP